MKNFNVLGLALALGLTYAIGMFALVIMMTNGWGNELLPLLQSIYKGVDASFAGAIVAALWGFVDGFIGGGIFAWLYNWFNSKCSCNKK